MKQIVVALIFLSLFHTAVAEPQQPQKVKLKADKMDFDQEKQLVRLIGNVRITSEGVVMTSPYAEYHLDEEMGDFVGGVKIVGKGTTATGKRMKVFYGEERAELMGNVRVVSDRGPGGEKSPTPTVLLSDELEYFWEKKEGIAVGSVKVRKADQRAFSDRAHYFQKRDLVIMEGNVRFEKGGEDWMTASRATMNLKDETVVAEGGVVARTRLVGKNEKGSVAREESKGIPASEFVEPRFRLLPLEAIYPMSLPGLK